MSHEMFNANSNGALAPLSPPPRLLMGPGPINCYPRVLSAMSTQLVGQYDKQCGYLPEHVVRLHQAVVMSHTGTTGQIESNDLQTRATGRFERLAHWPLMHPASEQHDIPVGDSQDLFEPVPANVGL